MSQVVVVGGLVTSHVLKEWLENLGIFNFVHIKLDVDDISPDALFVRATSLNHAISVTAMVITVGPMASKLMKLVGIIHGALPDTRSKTDINIALKNCRNYLTLRRFYGTGPSNPISR